MSNDDLRQLADDAGRAARLPDFAQLVRRGRRRRRVRRTTTGVAGLAVVAAMVVGAITIPSSINAGPATPGSTTSRSPHRISTSTFSVPPTATTSTGLSQQYLLHRPITLVNQPGAHLVQASFADPEHAAALWEICTAEDDICPEVVTWTSDGWSSSRAAVIPDKLNIYALPSGSVVVWLFGDNSFVISPDGQRHRIRLAHTSITAPPGGPFSNLPGGQDGSSPAGMFDSRSNTVYRPLTAASTRCVYDDDWDAHGRIWEYGTPQCGRHQRMSLAWSSNLGKTWSTKRLATDRMLGLVVGANRTAILLGGTAKGQRDVLRSLLVTDDGGRSWHRTDVAESSGVSVSSAATTNDGHLFICDGANLWAANSAWSAFHIVQPGRLTAFGVTAVGREVIAYGADPTHISISSDDGRSWHQIVPRP